MRIPFKGTFTQADLVRMFTLMLKHLRWMTFVFTPLVFFFAWLAFQFFNYPVTLLLCVITAGALGFLATFPFLFPYFLAPNSFKRQPEMRGPIEGVIGANEVTLRTLNTENQIKWSIWKRVLRTQNDVLLLQSNALFTGFTRTFFASEEDWQNFQKLIDEKIQSGALK